MKDYMKDKITLQIMEFLISGRGVDANINQLSLHLKHHRETIKERLKLIYEQNILDRPIYPYIGLLNSLKLFVVSKAEFSRDKKTTNFINSSPHLLSAFKFKEGVYNTITIQLHKDLYSYQSWSDNIYKNKLVTTCENQHFPEALFFSTKRILKFNPGSPIDIFEQEYGEKSEDYLNGCKIDKLTFDILRNIGKGEYIRTNENYIANELNINRKTITRKIRSLLEANILAYPRCFFPNLFAPSCFIVIFSFIELKAPQSEALHALLTDPHIVILIRANQAQYNIFTASTFPTIQKFLKWQESLYTEYPHAFGAIKNTFLSPELSFPIRQQEVALKFIRDALDSI